MLRSFLMSLFGLVAVGLAAGAQEAAQEKNTEPSVEQLSSAADGGDVKAMLQLGGVFETGSKSVKANPKMAFRQYQRASKAGSAVGDFHMARCHDTGVGVSKNPVQATRLYRKAALAGVVVANTVMARRYFEGKGLESDPVAAVGWLTRGSQAGSIEAMVLLGERFEMGDVVGKDLNRAGQLYSSAAQRNDPTGNYKLAMLYLKGIGTKADPVRAYVLLNKAQALPIAKTTFEELGKRLTAEQLELAKKKMSEAAAAAKAKESKK